MDERAVLIVVAFAVVDVEFAGRGAVGAERDEEGVRIVAHEGAGATGAVFARDDVAGADEEGDLVERGGEGDGAAGAVVGGVGEVVVVDLVGGQVDGYGVGALGHDGFHEKAGGAEVELVFGCEGGFVGGVDVVVWAEDGGAGDGGGVECGVPCWEQLVAESERLCYDGCVWFAGDVGFSATGVDVGVAAEEGVEGAGLVPTGQELFGWVSEETTNVGAGEGEAGDVVGEDHGDRGGEVGPFGLVVTGPHGA